MAAKKKEPNLRWLLQKKKHWWSEQEFSLQVWSETQNKYIDIPVVKEV